MPIITRCLTPAFSNPVGQRHMTLNEAIVTHKRIHFPKLSRNTVRLYETVINTCIVPALGLRQLHGIDHIDIVNLHLSLAHKPYLANRTLAYLSLLFNHYKIDPNPVRGVRRYGELRTETYLTTEDLKRLGNALSQHKSKPFVVAILLLLTTGVRRNEILNAEWKHVNWQTKQLLVPTSKTGKKYVVLNDVALTILQWAYSPTHKYIVLGDTPDSPRVNINKAWDKLRKELDLPHVRIHDIRHTFASLVANSNASIFTLRDLLHHSSVVVTERYVHLFDKTQREASNEALQSLGLEHILGPKDE